MAVPDVEDYDLSALELAITGSAPCPLPVLEYFQGRGVSFQEGFGLTETAPGATLLDASHIKEKLGSIGRPMFHVSTRIVDEWDRDVPVGEVGELLVRGPNVFAGYWGRPDATAEAFRGGWFHTGDLGRRRRRGFHHSGGPQEGHDHQRRGERLPDRGRTGALPPPGRS